MWLFCASNYGLSRHLRVTKPLGQRASGKFFEVLKNRGEMSATIRTVEPWKLALQKNQTRQGKQWWFPKLASDLRTGTGRGQGLVRVLMPSPCRVSAPCSLAGLGLGRYVSDVRVGQIEAALASNATQNNCTCCMNFVWAKPPHLLRLFDCSWYRRWNRWRLNQLPVKYEVVN